MNKIFKGKSMSFIALLLAVVMNLSLITQASAQGLDVKQTQQAQKLSVGETYSGFKVISNRYIEEADSNAIQFNHEKSGAKLIFLQNDDSNKVFSIGFRTPPKDDTGINHILEHSVLCGSKKYPSKDPFFTMNQQSLATFLNAYTTSDSTVYPVASRNEKDFFNLMSVYLDAVFYPNIYENPNIFKQEGWRYELNSKDEDIIYNGVVYNEMKGAYSNQFAILNDEINKSLFPNNIYKYSAGGKPEDIVKSTREQLTQTHKEFYTPSNSYMYLYGDLDIFRALEFINKEYLSSFDKVSVDSSIKLQKPLDKRQHLVAEYPVSESFSVENQTYLTSNYVIGTIKDKEDIIGVSILNHILFALESSPLKKALTDARLGSNVSSSLSIGGGIQPVYSIFVENSEEELKDKFEETINNTLSKIIKDGIDKELVELAFNSYLQQVRVSEANNTFKGMGYNSVALLGWLYDEDPTLYLEQDKEIESIRKKADKGYFEDLIKKYLLNNNHSSTVILKPKAGLEEENARKVSEELRKYKESLSESEIEDLIKQTNDLRVWQQTPDTIEDLEKLPTLQISDLETRLDKFDSTKEVIDEIEVVSRNLYTNDVSYISLYFDTSSVPQDKIQYIELLTDILGNVSTQNYDKESLARLIQKEFASMEFNLETYENYKDNNGNKEYYTKLAVPLIVLDEDLPNTFSILDEVINKSNFSEKEVIYNTIKENISYMEHVISSRGDIMAMNRALSYIDDKGKYDELGMMEYYKFLKDLEQDLDSKLEDIGKNLKQVSDIVFNKDNLLVTHTGSEEGYKEFKQSFIDFTKAINNQNLPKVEYKFDYSVKNEAFTIPSPVQNIAKVYDYNSGGYEFSGEMLVLQNIIDEYLLQSIRIEGGAYGAGMFFTRDGKLVFLSYRDPNLEETLQSFDASSEYLKYFCENVTQEQLTNYIIGAMAQFETPRGAISISLSEDTDIISGLTHEDREKLLEQIKNTTVEDIAKYIGLLEKSIEEGVYCVFGNGQKIDENKELFEHIESALK